MLPAAPLDKRTPLDKAQARKQALWNERTSYDSHAQDIADYLLPRAARFTSNDRNRGDAAQYNSIIDETGTQAHGVLEAGLMAGLTSPARPWVKLATPDKDLMEYQPVKIWLSKVTARMLQIFAKSNTYRAFRTVYGQISAFPAAANVVVSDFQNVIHNYPLTWGSYALGLNHRGQVDTLCRTMRKTVQQMAGDFGLENCSATVKNLYQTGSYDATVEILHLIEPRRERDYSKRDNRNMPFKSCYFETATDRPDKFLRESGFEEFPAVCPRWLVEGDDTYASRWPAAIALGSIKQLQQEQLQKSTAIDYQVDPPLQAPIELKGHDVDRLPGGLTYASMNTPHAGIRSLYEVNLNLAHLLGDIQDVRGRINTTFFVDLFKMLANDTRSNITAREIAERHEEKLLMLGPVLESLYNELLQPMIDITFAKMLRAGLFAPGQELAPPPELHGQDLDVEFISALAQAQRAVGVQSVDRLVGTIGSLAMLKPDVLDKLDADQTVDVVADQLGTDPSLIVADDKVALIRKGRAAQQAMAQAAAMAQPAKDMAQAGQAMAETDQGKLAAAMGQFSGYAIPGVTQ